MLKVMTLNLNYRSDRYGAWAERRARIVRLLEDARPHIVALQAVEENERGQDQAHELADAAGYAQALFVPADTAARRGSGLLADRKPTTVRTQVLTTPGSAEDPSERVVLAAEFAAGTGTLWVVNGHFSWVADQNQDNVREALTTVASLGGPALLLGDFNAPPESPGMTRIAATGWVDAWAEHCPGAPGHTFASDKPSQRIDYIWVPPTLRGHIRSVAVLAGGRAPVSDHCALLASLDLEGETGTP